VADLRCGTPSIAAHAVVPDRRAIDAELAGLLERAAATLGSQRDQVKRRLERAEVSGALAAGLERARSRLGHAGDRLGWVHPGPVARVSRQRLGACDWRRPFAAQLAAGHAHLAGLHRHAWSLSPQHVVERGFAVARRGDGTIVRGPEEVEPGEEITVTVARGVIAATVAAPVSGQPREA
jgi:exodeoxyribonuclease VII large subunit